MDVRSCCSVGDQKQNPQAVASDDLLTPLVNAFNAWAATFNNPQSSPAEGESLGNTHFQNMLELSLKLLGALKKENGEDIDKAATKFIEKLNGSIRLEESKSSSDGEASVPQIHLTQTQLHDVTQRLHAQERIMSAQLQADTFPAIYTSELYQCLRGSATYPILLTPDNHQTVRDVVEKLYKDIIFLIGLLGKALPGSSTKERVQSYALQNLFVKIVQSDLYTPPLNIFADLDRAIKLVNEDQIFKQVTLGEGLANLKKLLLAYNNKHGGDSHLAAILERLGQDTVTLINHAYRHQCAPTSKVMGAEPIDIYKEVNEYQNTWSKCPSFLKADSSQIRFFKAITAIALGVLVCSVAISLLSILAGCISYHFFSVSLVHCFSALWYQAEAGIALKTITGVFSPILLSVSGHFGYAKFRHFKCLNNSIGQAITKVADDLRSLDSVQVAKQSKDRA